MKEQGLRVLHITSGLGVGGAETMLYRLVQSLHGKHGQQHSVISLNDNCSFDFDALGVPVRVIDFKKKGPILGMMRLRREIRAQSPHVIQGWMYHGNFASTLAAPRSIPVAWSIHHSLHNLQNESLPIRLMIRTGGVLGKRANTRRIIFVSGKSEHHHRALGYPQEKLLVIPNGFNCSEFAPDDELRRSCRLELGFDENHLLIGNFGRYDPIKDHGLLLRAFAAVTREFPAARLILAGGGISDANPDLGRLIREAGAGNKVRLLGPRSDMPRLYNALDLYALSSKSESFPNVLGEASACGVPCVTTDVGDARRIIGDAGLAVPTGSEAKLAAAMLEFLRMEPSLRRQRGALARDHVSSHYGLPVVARTYTQLYEELAREASAHL